MSCKIYLRRDQHSSQREKYSVEGSASIFAPSWVREALQILGQRLKGTTFEVYDNSGRCSTDANKHAETVDSLILEKILITEDFNQYSLKILQKIARNEAYNVSGRINFKLYQSIQDRSVLYSIRDLVRQCVIVGVDESSRCGGYHCHYEVQTKERVYICDLAALQFQESYNTGRLILLQKHEPHIGLLDDFIYQNVVGEKKRSFQEVAEMLENADGKLEIETITQIKNRYFYHCGFDIRNVNPCFIDIQAYRKFVAFDVILAGMSLSTVASIRNDRLHFKFLKYGTGFFAGRFQREIERHILSGVVDGLEKLYEIGGDYVLNTIKCVELPFFKMDPPSAKRIKLFENKFRIEVVFSTNDALKQTQPFSCHVNEKLFIGTTNCGDNHAVCGNEMGFRSVDAAISENIASKGNLLCPNMNTLISEKYISI